MVRMDPLQVLGYLTLVRSTWVKMYHHLYSMTRRKKLQTSRGKAMLKKARVDVAKSVLDNAEKWGVKIIHIDGALKWVQKEKEKALSVKGEQPNTQKVPQKKDKPKKEKLLKSPVVKFESTTRGYRPLYLELDSWPHVNVDTALGTCPFDTVCRGARSGCKRAALQAERLGAFEPLQPPLSSQGEDREQDTPRANTAKKDISGKTDSVGFAQIVTAGQLKRLTEKKRRAEKKRGYCECCKMKYEDLFKHLRGEEHRQYVGQEADHYRDLDSLIAKGPCAEDFVNSVKMEQSGPGSVDSPVLSPVSSVSTEEYILLLSPFRGKFNNQPTEKVPASPKNRCKKNPQKLIATERRHEHHLQDTEDWKQIRKEPNTVKTKTKNQRRKQTRREIKSPKQTKKECEQNVEILLPDSKSSKKETPRDEDKQHVEPDFRKLNVSKQKCDPVDIVKMKRISTDTKGDQTVSSERKNITNQNISVNLKEECVRAEENNSDVQKMKLEETRSLEKRIKPCSVACEVLVLSPTKQYCLRSGKIDPTPLSAKTNSNNEGPGIKTCLKNESYMVLPTVQTNANLSTKEESKNTAPVDFVGINSRSVLDDEKLILAQEDCRYTSKDYGASSVDRYKGSDVQSESVTSVEKDVKGRRRRTRLSLSKTQKQTSPQQSEPNSLKQGSVHSVDTAGIISKAQTSHVSLKNEGQDVAGSIIPASQASTSSVAKPKKKARIAAAKTIRNCKRLGFYKSKWRTFRSVRHFKLPEKWRMLTNRSVKKLFSSDEDSQTFEGFTEADLAHNGAIRSDMSFEEKSEICLEEGSEIEWEITMKSQETLMNESVPSELQTNTNIVQNEASAFQLSFSKTPRNADRYNKSFEFSPPIDKSGSVATETLEILKNTPNKTGNNDFQFSSPISPACVWQWKNKGRAAKKGRKTPLVKPLQAKGENVSWTRSVTKNDFVDNLRNQDSDTSFIFSDPIHEPLISPLNTPSKAVLSSGNRCEVNPDMDDDEVVFNFSSPQKLKTVFSPLKSSDCCLLSSPITNKKDYDRTILADKQVRKSSSSKRLNLGYSNTDAIFSTPVKSRNANNEMDLTGNLQQRNLRCSTPNKTIRSLKIVDNLPMPSQFSSPLKCQEALSSGFTAAPSVVQMGQKSFTKNEQSPLRNMYLGYAKTPTKNTPTKQFECVRGRGADKNKTATPMKKLSSNDSDEIRKVNASENRTETENKTSSISIVCEIQLRRSPRKKSTDLCSVKLPKAGSRKSISSCLAKPKSQPLEIRLSAEKEKDKTDDPCRSLPPRKLLKKSLNETDKKVPHVYRFDYITTSKGNPAKFGHMQHSKSRKCTVSSSKRSYCPSEIVKAANKRQKRTDKENDNFTGTPENDMVDFDKSSVEKWKAKNCNVLTKTEDYQRRPKSEILHYSKTFLKKQVLLNSCKNNESEVTVDSNNKSGRTSKMVIAMKKEFNQAKKLRTSPRKAGVTQYDFESSG